MVSFGYSTLLPLILSQLIFHVFSTTPVVETKYGKVRGAVLKSFHGRDFFAFQGIPFAQPPLGELRFQDPQKPEKYEGVLDASKPIDDCIQRNMLFNSYPLKKMEMNPKQVIGKEDCLYLNVYTPKLFTGEPLPVMVYIHGGGFELGSSSSKLHGPEFFLDKEIVLVTVNYRLGPIGFLSFEDDALPGNLGLKDQIAALYWTKENIEKFGGNPHSITLFGESAGATSVSLLMSSSKTKGLFNRTITQSGSRFCFWATGKPGFVRENSLRIAKSLNCPAVSSQEALSCLRKIPAEEIVLALNGISAAHDHGTMNFIPVLEKNYKEAVITKDDLYKPTEIPWMTGITSGEGLIAYDGLVRNGVKDLSLLNENYLNVFPDILFYRQALSNVDEVTEEMKAFYLGEKITSDSLEEFVKMGSDIGFIFGNYKAALNHKGKLYQYYYNHRGQRSFSELNRNGDSTMANHADDLFSLFYMKKLFPSDEYNVNDENVRELSLNLWTNFATFEDPTPPGRNLKWELTNSPDEFFNINAERPEMIKLPIMERMKFLDKLTRDESKHVEL